MTISGMTDRDGSLAYCGMRGFEELADIWWGFSGGFLRNFQGVLILSRLRGAPIGLAVRAKLGFWCSFLMKGISWEEASDV